jgi:hypothetical protein
LIIFTSSLSFEKPALQKLCVAGRHNPDLARLPGALEYAKQIATSGGLAYGHISIIPAANHVIPRFKDLFHFIPRDSVASDMAIVPGIPLKGIDDHL